MPAPIRQHPVNSNSRMVHIEQQEFGLRKILPFPKLDLLRPGANLPQKEGSFLQPNTTRLDQAGDNVFVIRASAPRRTKASGMALGNF